jgi:hypothetical protein
MEEVLRRLRSLRPDSERRWGRMTANQAVCHLSDSFKSVTGGKRVEFAGSLATRTFVKWFALRVPLRWPKGVPTRPEVDQEKDGTRPVEFERDVAELESLVEEFAREGRDFRGNKHPVFGEMSESDWLRWGYLHMDHHLRQFGV